MSAAGEKLAANLGQNCIFFQGDVCDSDALTTSVEKTEAAFGAYISLNVNCAGTATSRLLFDQKSEKVHCEKSFERVMKTNVFGTFNVMRHLSKAMAKNQGNIEVQKVCFNFNFKVRGAVSVFSSYCTMHSTR